MQITILNPNLDRESVVDVVDSVLWTDRYSSAGDFEVYTPATLDMLSRFRQGYYLTIPSSDHVMIIESVNLKTNLEEGNKFIVKGRSLESILDRRIIWKQTIVQGSLQTGIEKLLDENAIIPENPDRKIRRLVFEENLDVDITGLQVDSQFTGDNLYEVIQALCDVNGIGFRIALSPDKEFIFKLYKGEDRSYAQDELPVLKFSPNLDNLSQTDYFHSNIPWKTVTLVGGEGEGADRLTAIVPLDSNEAGTDLDRRELFTDARDVSIFSEGEVINPQEYYALLYERGLLSLVENSRISTFEGKLDSTTTYLYGRDFFLGDIVQVENEYGIKGRSLVSELMFSENLSGTFIYPLFQNIE